MRKILVVLALMVLALPLPGGESKTNLKALVPFLDDQVFAVVRLDVAVDPFGKLKDLGFPARGLEEGKKLAGKWREEIHQAGGKELFLVWSLADRLGEPFVVIPTKGEDEAKTLADALKRPLAPGALAKGSVTLAGNSDTINRLATVQAAARPELARAFAQIKNMPIQAVFIPPPVLRRSLVESFPKLPKEIGGGSSKEIDQSFQFAAAGAEITPKVSFRLVLQAKDADAAKELESVLDKAFQGLLTAKQGAQDFPELKVILPLLTPKVQDDKVVLAIDDQTYSKIMVPMVARVRNAAQRNQDANHLKQMALAMHNYMDVYKTFPAQYSSDKQGKPLLSWRVHILPFVEQDNLYRQFKLDEPWDSEHNKKLIPMMPPVYKSPFQKNVPAGKTTYLVPVGKNTIFPGAKGTSIRDITDGTSNTIMVVEVNDENAVTWTKPDDFKVDVKKPLAILLRPGAKGFNVAMADGSVRYVPRTISLETLRAAFTRNGGEILGPDW
jgi:prepilin-type processing-associated H-X9-DG protein